MIILTWLLVIGVTFIWYHDAIATDIEFFDLSSFVLYRIGKRAKIFDLNWFKLLSSHQMLTKLPFHHFIFQWIESHVLEIFDVLICFAFFRNYLVPKYSLVHVSITWNQKVRGQYVANIDISSRIVKKPMTNSHVRYQFCAIKSRGIASLFRRLFWSSNSKQLTEI